MMRPSLVILGLGVALLVGCARRPVIHYNPDDFVRPDRVVSKTVRVSVLPRVHATYGIGNDPAVVRAYRHWQRTGKMRTVRGDGWVTWPYSPRSRPVIACSPLHFCIVQLEKGERLNSYGLGDTRSWKTSAFLTGKGRDSSISIEVKPVRAHLSTDMTVSTSRRTYLIGLVSRKAAGTTVLRFYYPEETRIASLRRVQNLRRLGARENPARDAVIASGVSPSRLNFDYRIMGDHPPWRPLRVFDDSFKTYIELPGMASRFTLPVLYLARNRARQLVNYRYHSPWLVIDGLFSRAWLVSGRGRNQVRVEVINRRLPDRG